MDYPLDNEQPQVLSNYQSKGKLTVRLGIDLKKQLITFTHEQEISSLSLAAKQIIHSHFNPNGSSDNESTNMIPLSEFQTIKDRLSRLETQFVETL